MVDRPNRSVRAEARLRTCLSSLISLLLLSACVTGPTRAAVPGAPIPWRTHFESAQAEALATGRPLWVQFSGPWCHFCRLMETEVFTHPEVAALGQDAFIPVKVDSEERADLLPRYGVQGLPATVLLSSAGQILDRRDGYTATTEFLAFLAARQPAPIASVDTAPAPSPEIALAGYDPVSLVKGEGLTAGDPELSVRYDGFEYRFAAASDRDAFLRHPERFLPAGHGICPVSLIDAESPVAGDPRFGVYYRGRLYLCADEPARQRFAADPARYADADLADDGHCPHCRSLAGRLVRGVNQFSAIYRGRRYLFPDETHRTAFRTAPERYLR